MSFQTVIKKKLNHTSYTLPTKKDQCLVVYQVTVDKGEERLLEMFPSEQRWLPMATVDLLLDMDPQDLQDYQSMTRTTKIQTCWDKPFSDAPFTFRMTSPTSICPHSAAGCPGKSFFTLTIVEPICSGVRLSSRQKLNPRPELFFSSFTSNVFSAKKTLTDYFLNHTGH